MGSLGARAQHYFVLVWFCQDRVYTFCTFMLLKGVIGKGTRGENYHSPSVAFLWGFEY